MPNTIIFKKSGVSNNAPSSLELGELAINYADGFLYYKNGSSVISKIKSNNVSTIPKWTTARTITLSGDATGNVSIDGSSNVNLAVQVVDDSHNHIISNVDGLQDDLNNKAPIIDPTFTDNVTISKDLTVDTDTFFINSVNNRVGVGTTSPNSKLTVSNGDIKIVNSINGIILRSPNGSRWRVTIDNTGALITNIITNITTENNELLSTEDNQLLELE
jgi:hypothetical protein